MKRLFAYFLQGLIFLVPGVLSIWVIATLFVTIDDWMRMQIRIDIPGIGVLVLVTAVTLVGFFASNFVTRRSLAWADAWLERVPLVKLLHSSLRDLMKAFVGKERRFGQPVVVDLTGSGGARAIGFLTRDSLQLFGMPDHVAVYFPQAYNFAGQVLVFPRTAVRPLDAVGTEIMTFLVSGGVAGR